VHAIDFPQSTLICYKLQVAFLLGGFLRRLDVGTVKLFSKSSAVYVQAQSTLCSGFPLHPVVRGLLWQSRFLLTSGGWVAPPR